MIWRAESVDFRYPGATQNALSGVSFSLEAGSFTAVLGPNGSGKSTLLRAMLGTLSPAGGSIEYRDRPLQSWPRGELAREIGVVSQSEEIAFPITVRDLVGMGRYPHLGLWRGEGPADREAVERAMAECDVRELAARPISTLSGGERQRARVARALAQEPRVLALDEPTVALDLRHAMAIFELLRHLTGRGVTVLLVTHDINLAARYARRLILMDAGRVVADGTPRQVITRPLLERVYGWPIGVTEHPGPGPDTGAPQIAPLAPTRAPGAPAGEPGGMLSEAQSEAQSEVQSDVQSAVHRAARCPEPAGDDPTIEGNRPDHSSSDSR